MKRIRYSEHLLTRLSLRNLFSDLPLKIYQEAKERFEDKETGHKVAIKVTQVYGYEREVMVAYEEDAEIVILTIHPLKEGQKENRIASGRWVKL